MSNSQNKLMIVLIILSSFIGFLEWGGENRSFLFQMEIEIISKLFTNPGSVIHPFTILPLLGQLMLIFSLVRHPVNKKLVYWGMGLIGILFIFILFIGIIGVNWKIIICSLPFLTLSLLYIFLNRK